MGQRLGRLVCQCSNTKALLDQRRLRLNSSDYSEFRCQQPARFQLRSMDSILYVSSGMQLSIPEGMSVQKRHRIWASQ
ncbi:hypothetical protein Y027_4694 [Burkholderia pseudomallei TSV5]|nr:hypothetical protein Y027_4694 [Burkholderia pseudomallei TSV5]